MVGDGRWKEWEERKEKKPTLAMATVTLKTV